MSNSQRYQEAMHITKVGIWANIGLIIIKFAAGILGKSSALIADAVHSFSDFASDILVITGLKIAEKPPDCSHKYGHGKFETLSAILLGFLLILTGIGIALNGLGKINLEIAGNPLQKPAWIAVFAAFCSILVKEVLYHYTVRVGRRIESPSLIANAIHHRSDALSSIGALLGVTGAIILGKNWRLLDPLAAVIVSIFIFKVSISIIKTSLDELLEASLGEDTENEILEIAASVPGVTNPHNLRTRRIGSYIAMDIHIEVDDTLNIKEAHKISSAVEEKLEERFGRSAFTSVHVEPATPHFS